MFSPRWADVPVAVGAVGRTILFFLSRRIQRLPGRHITDFTRLSLFRNNTVRFAALLMQANTFFFNVLHCSPPRLPHVCHRMARAIAFGYRERDDGICVERLSCPGALSCA